MAASASASSTGHVSVTPCIGLPLDALAFKPSVSGFLGFDAALFRENRARLAAALKDAKVPAGSVVVLQGSPEVNRDDTDHEPFFRQNSHFLWAMGVNIPDCYAAINVDDGSATLFVPRLPASFAVWMGKIKEPSEFVAEYGVEAVQFTDELATTLEAASPSKLLLLTGENSDSGATFPPATFEGLEAFASKGIVDTTTLFPIFVECRVFKTDRELAILRHVIGAASDGHCVMMRGVRAGMREDGLEALFKFWMQSNVGARYQAYTYICGSGNNAATLHYGHAGAPNDRIIGPDELVLCDCGNELYGFISDITTSFPSTGAFTPDQRIVYSAVLSALEGVESAMKPGVCWKDMQTLAYRCILETLKAGGLLQGEVDDMMAVNLGAVFMPHGLGHFLGVDTHDVGGYLGDATPRDERAGYRSLRTTRTLRERMCITVEPGCYFVDHLLDEALENSEQSRFLVMAVIARFRGCGGVRLEDNVLITASGIENFVFVPRTIDEVEAMCSGKVDNRAGFAKRHQG